MENGTGNPSFHRPVTVLPALNNVFEKLLASQLDQLYSEILSEYISDNCCSDFNGYI